MTCLEAARVDEVWMRDDDIQSASNQSACSQDTAKLSLTAVAPGAARDRRAQSEAKNTDEFLTVCKYHQQEWRGCERMVTVSEIVMQFLCRIRV